VIPLPYSVILATQSPRRRELMKGLDIPFTIMTKNTPEDFPDDLKGSEIALYLSRRKAEAFTNEELPGDYLLITADTIVWINNHVLNKPVSHSEASAMLTELSGNRHTVFTGVTLRSRQKTVSFCSATDVWFRHLSEDEINYYLNKYKPYDKAGSYGVQEWIGFAAIKRIEGSYFNVMGLPTQQLFLELYQF